MQAVATWRKGHEFLLEDGRAHSVLIDLPPEGGGASAGTTALELSVLALAGSLAATFAMLARKRHLDFSGLTLVLESDSPSPAAGGVHGTLRLRTHAERSDVDALVRSALEQCPVNAIFRAAGVPVNVVTVVSPVGRST